jgi:hypothetical protein
MATLDHGERTPLTGLVTAARVLLVLTFSAVETAALTIWLAVVDGVPIASVTIVVGFGMLVLGLGVVHVLTDLAVNGLDLTVPIRTVVGLSVSEAVLWGVWLAIAGDATSIDGFVLAGTVLAVLLIPQHTVGDNALSGRPAFSSLLDPGTFGFSVVKSAGATVWLLFVHHPRYVLARIPALALASADPAAIGLAILTLALFVEHNIAVTYSRNQ